jgi:hypothetical protein
MLTVTNLENAVHSVSENADCHRFPSLYLEVSDVDGSGRHGDSASQTAYCLCLALALLAGCSTETHKEWVAPSRLAYAYNGQTHANMSLILVLYGPRWCHSQSALITIFPQLNSSLYQILSAIPPLSG